MTCKTWTWPSAWTLANSADPDQTPADVCVMVYLSFLLVTMAGYVLCFWAYCHVFDTIVRKKKKKKKKIKAMLYANFKDHDKRPH